MINIYNKARELATNIYAVILYYRSTIFAYNDFRNIIMPIHFYRQW